MKEQLINKIENKPGSEFKLSVGLVNGYYLSFLAAGVLMIIVKIDISADLKQGLFFILLWLIFGSIDLLKQAANREVISDVDKIQNIVHNYYDRVGDNNISSLSDRKFGTISINNRGDTINTITNKGTINTNTPSNYFDVIKTIEVIPDSLDPSKPGIKDILVELQSYVESDYALSLSEKEVILETIKSIAIEARVDPNNDDFTFIVESIQEIGKNPDFRLRVINALKSVSMTVVDLHAPNYIKALTAFIIGWKESERK